MLSVAFKNLFQEKTKLAISIGGVAFAVLLIVLINGLYQGWSKQMGSYIQSMPSDLWVAQQGSSDMFHSVSFVPSDLKNQLKNIPGIAEANELYGHAFAFKLNGKDKSLYIIGLNPSNGFGQPIRMKEGSWRDLQTGQIIIDESFAKKNSLKSGDILNIGGKDLIISGISSGGNMLVTQYSFVTQEEAKSLFSQEDKVNYYGLNVASGSNIDHIRQQVSQFPNLKVMTKAEFVENNQRIINDSFLPIISVLDLIGLLIGIAVIGLTIYSATVDKSREYGVMKAIGLNNGQLFKLTIWQSLISGLIGYCIGLALSYIAAYFAKIFVPDFITSIRGIDLLLALGATLAMSIIASYIPIKRIASIDPAEVFKN